MRIHQTDKPALEAALFLHTTLQTHPEPILLLVSGGSSIEVLDHAGVDASFERITLGLVDERFAVTEKDSNTAVFLSTSFFERARARGAAFLDPRQEGPDDELDEVALQYGTALKAWRSAYPDGCVVTLLGIGSDGHTAGVLPMENQARFDELFVGTERWFVGYEYTATQNLFSQRLTVTLNFLQSQVDEAIVYATGSGDYEILRSLEEGTAKLHTVPAAIFSKMKSVHVYTDK